MIYQSVNNEKTIRNLLLILTIFCCFRLLYADNTILKPDSLIPKPDSLFSKNDTNIRKNIVPAESLNNIIPESLKTVPFESIPNNEQAQNETLPEEPRVTNVFYDTDLLEALKAISGQTGVTILTDGTVNATVTLELKDLPLEECLKRMLFPLGYSFKKIEDYYLVGSNKSENGSFHLLSSTELIKLNYIKAKDAGQLIANIYLPYIKIDPDINALTITAPNQIIEKFKQDLSNIDKPPRQVQIDAIITEISTDALKELGIKWSGTLKKGNDSLNILADFANLVETSTELVYKTITRGLGGNWAYTFLLPQIQAMVQSGKAEIKANPKIVTLEGQTASINVGKEQYYQMLGGEGQNPYYHFEVVKYGTSLNITPFVSDKDEITVEVEPEVSDFLGNGLAGLPTISRRSVKTQVRVKDGDRIVIGGLKSKNEQVIQKKIPLLGDIPLLGALFRYNHKVTDKTDIVIIITPHILK